jgi:hypothetical protein
MKNTTKLRRSKPRDLRREYAFDYGESRSNRFAMRFSGDVVAVVLEPDVARVFGSARRVNEALRSVISAMPRQTRKARSARRKAS